MHAHLDPHLARLTLTWKGQQGDLPDPVPYDMTDASLKVCATEALRGGGIAGIDPDPRADLSDFVVDRFPARDDLPFHRISIRPKTPFGTGGGP